MISGIFTSGILCLKAGFVPFLGTYNGIAFWVEYSFPVDGNDMVWTTGLDGIPLPGEFVRWNPYHRQGVYLTRHGQKIQKGDQLYYECLIDYESGEMSGKFSFDRPTAVVSEINDGFKGKAEDGY